MRCTTAPISRNNYKRLEGPVMKIVFIERSHTKTFQSIFTFQIASTEDRETRFASSIRSTVRQVQIDYPYINWLNLLNGCLKGLQTVNETDTVLVLNPTYFRKLGSILQATANRRIGNYFALSTIIYGASRLHMYDKSVHVSEENCLLSTKER